MTDADLRPVLAVDAFDDQFLVRQLRRYWNLDAGELTAEWGAKLDGEARLARLVERHASDLFDGVLAGFAAEVERFAVQFGSVLNAFLSSGEDLLVAVELRGL